MRVTRLRFPSRNHDYRDAVLATNPVGYWRLGEASGTVAIDEMGANNGTYIGTPTFGVPGALAGDSNTAVGPGCAYLASVLGLGVSNWTIAGWIKVPALGNYGVLAHVGKWADGDGTDGYGAYISNTGYMVLSYAGGYEGAFGSLLTPGAWVFYALTRGTGAVLAYLNGALDWTGPIDAPGLAPTTRTYLGTSKYTVSEATPPALDEPAIWARALTADEIAELYRIAMGR